MPTCGEASCPSGAAAHGLCPLVERAAPNSSVGCSPVTRSTTNDEYLLSKHTGLDTRSHHLLRYMLLQQPRPTLLSSDRMPKSNAAVLHAPQQCHLPNSAMSADMSYLQSLHNLLLKLWCHPVLAQQLQRQLQILACCEYNRAVIVQGICCFVTCSRMMALLWQLT